MVVPPAQGELNVVYAHETYFRVSGRFIGRAANIHWKMGRVVASFSEVTDINNRRRLISPGFGN